MRAVDFKKKVYVVGEEGILQVGPICSVYNIL